MDVNRGKAVLPAQLRSYRTKPYEELERLVGHVEAYDVTSVDGTVYQIEIQVFWDDKTDGNIRVAGAVDDGGWRAFVPVTDDFIMTPDGTFLGE